jgi:hypothetical protein
MGYPAAILSPLADTRVFYEHGRGRQLASLRAATADRYHVSRSATLVAANSASIDRGTKTMFSIGIFELLMLVAAVAIVITIIAFVAGGLSRKK